MPKRSIEESMRRAQASNALSGKYATEEQRKLIKANLEGKITDEEFLKKVLELALK
ncbi:hypothetical protein [Terribacillus saccharophilus]|uniref:hypothetical protein n=1 Tax=Terribacillus saccharophilus TaxID=361277 RepID=UPI001482C4C2|nr:hypothetical protein [Terribacillus saccharophilus]